VNAEGEQRLHSWEAIIGEAFDSRHEIAGRNWEIRCYNQVDSTMQQARELAVQIDEKRNGLVLAARQLQGRGRQGRQWISAQEGFYCTYIFRGAAGTAELPGFSLAAGCIVGKFLDGLGCKTGLKWPNDIVSRDGRKAGGVLIEAPGQSQGLILCGVGINIFGAPAAVAQSISLFELCGRKISPVDLAAGLSPLLLQGWREFLQHGFAGFREEWSERSVLRGRRVRLEGDPVREGAFKGVDDKGCMLLETGHGLEAVPAGHILAVY